MANTRNHKPLLIKLLCAVAAMFVFAYALVPLYNVLCRVSGINEDPTVRMRIAQPTVDQSRFIRVEFLTQNNQDMPWEFRGPANFVDVHPGESVKVLFYAKNLTDKDMVAQAIPSVTPVQATAYVQKTECFCFNRQPLSAGAETDMPLVFYIDPNIPENIGQLTLSYTLFDITERGI